MDKSVKRIRRVLFLLGAVFILQLFGDAYWFSWFFSVGRDYYAWDVFWELAFPHLRDAVFCFVLAWIVGRLGQGAKAEEDMEKKEE